MKVNYDEPLSVLIVIVGCVLASVAAHSILVGAAAWFCIGGMMVAIKSWIKTSKGE